VSFGPKLLQARFDGLLLGGGSLTLSNMRMSADIAVGKGDAQSKLTLAIYGMTLSHMNQLSTAGASYNTFSGTVMTVTLSASDGGDSYSTVFTGDVPAGLTRIDATDQPNVRFLVAGVHGAANARKKMEPTTKKGAVDGVGLIQQLAKKMGWRFENSGVKATMLRNPYLWGTGISQIRQCAEAMNCEFATHLGTLSIFPNGGARSGVYQVFPPKLVGYPSFDMATMSLTAYYDPAYTPFDQVEVSGSQLTGANGTWNSSNVNYELDALQPHGRWYMTMDCTNPRAASSGGDPGGDQG
jgi:hypothetical protein